ncbi:hypothetical protein [Hyphomicrobium sp.]|uniref:hypothetical protein n=1 Tax=Hyphomicrobium sp. TaxID=82 RepID=UPI002E304AF1|nr:hypothetical protein [Hyphomicrobium sp.]HEX2841370.1 hypothetical protein [Hyphomicrobium sp.]
MSNVAPNLNPRQTADLVPGITTASVLVVTTVSTIVGGLVGMFLYGMASPAWLAVVAGFSGTLIAALLRNTLLVSAWETADIKDAGTPAAVVVYALVASIAGSLAAYQLVSDVGQVWSGVTGMLAGLLSAGLLSLLMVTYRMEPEEEG